MKISIYPKSNSDKQDYCVFQIQITGIGKPIQYSTGEKIQKADLKYWEGGAVAQSQRGTDLFKLNAKFERMKKVAEQAYKDGADIREALNRMPLNRRPDTTPTRNKPAKISDFYSLLDQICVPGFKRDRKDRPLEPASIRSYQNLRSLLKKYDPQLEMNFEDWTVIAWQLFRQWMEKHGVRKSTKGLSDKSIETACRLLRSVLNDGYDRDLAKVTPWRKKGFNAVAEKKKKPYLKQDEIDLFYNLKITDPEIKLCRDYWVMAAENGGMRFIDWHFIRDGDYVESGKYLEFIPKKTKKHDSVGVRIYLNPRFKAIQASYGGKMLPLPSYHIVLRKLKAAFAMAGLPNLRTHSNRSSYINNQLKSGLSKTFIKTVTGHHSDAFDNYVSLDKIDSGNAQEQHARQLAKKVRFGKLKAV